MRLSLNRMRHAARSAALLLAVAALALAPWPATLAQSDAASAKPTAAPAVQTTPPAARSVAPAAQLIPDNALLVVGLRDGYRAVDDFRGGDLFKRILASDAYKSLEKQSEYMKAKGGLMMFAGAAGLDPWAAVQQVAGRDLLLALLPPPKEGNHDKPDVLIVLTPQDAAATRSLLNSILVMSGAIVDGEPVEARSRLVDGVRGYSISDDLYVAEFDEHMVFANRAKLLEGVIRERRSGEKKLATNEHFTRAARDLPREALLWAFADVRQFKSMTGDAFNKKLDNGLAGLLFGGAVEAFRSADYASAWLRTEADGVVLDGRAFGEGGGAEWLKTFAVNSEESRDWSKLDLPGLMSQVALARDWVGIWEARESIIDADGLRGLTEFANTLTTLMGGMDFHSQFLTELKPTLRFLAARQKLAEGAAPTPELPGFALVMHLKNAQQVAPRLENAALMTMSIINVDMGQKMQPQFQLTPRDYHGARMLVGKYPEKTDPGPRGIRYNFEPAISVFGDRFVICTSEKMLENLIDAVEKLPAAAGKAGELASDTLHVDLGELSRLLDANREVFIANQMLEQDFSRERATARVGMLLEAARMLGQLSMRVGPVSDGLNFSLRIGLAR
ncbi:MAG: hypothetical protein CHACPFDD_02892 [Phycisphaerae bacterium]|nr:hypothetical protein [Phycisphaerae bacterium]